MLTGLGRTFHFFQGMRDASNDMVNPVKIFQGANQFGHQLADVVVADPDGHKASGGALARNTGHGFVESINPLNKPTAYATGQATANLVVTVVPVVGEAGALNDLRLGLKAATLSRDAAEAGLKAAQTVPEKAAAARLRAAEEQVAQVKAALREKIPGVGARKMAAKARMAGQKLKDRRAGGAGPSVRPLAPRTPEQVAAAEKKFNAQKQGALEEARHTQLHRRQPALVGGHSHSAGVARPTEAPGGPSTAAIGQPGGKSGTMRAEGEGSNTTRPTLKENIRKAIPPGSRRLSNPTVASTKVPYNKFDLSRKIVEYRKANNLMDSEGNLAVIEYTHNGVKSWEIGESEFNGPHSEESAWGKLYGKGIRPEEIERVYTEREPCTLPAHACGRWMNSIFPNTKVFHSFDYGQTAASRAAGNEALKRALQSVKEGK